MQEKDSATNRFLKDNRRFAEVFNMGVFGGNQVLQEDTLKEIDRTSGTMMKGKNQKKKAITKYRDIVKESEVGVSRIITAVENQTDIHYAMPVKVFALDAFGYDEQRARIQNEHRKNRDLKNEEFVSGFSKEDKIKPTITLVVYYGEKPWDGPKTLHELLDFKDVPQYIKEKVMDYKLHILEVRKLKNLNWFQSDVGIVFGFLQRSSDKDGLRRFIDEHKEAFKEVPEDAYDVMSELTSYKKLDTIKEKNYKGGKVDMCKAIEDMIEDGREEGETRKIIKQVCCKLKKKQDASTIADALEENEAYIQKIITAARPFAPEYNVDRIYEKLK